MPKTLLTALSWLTSLLTPILLLGLALRALLTPAFLEIEYRLPGFPADEYGFSIQDRLRYAPYALEFLVEGHPPSYLGALTFPNGEPLFNQREISHLEDVRVVTRGALAVWYATLLLALGLGGWAKAGNWGADFLRGLQRGGRLAVALVAGLGAFAALAFWQFFTLFHGLFFEGDSWLFLYSDTLIRLFPIRFWQDAFLAAGAIVLGLGFTLGWGLPSWRAAAPLRRDGVKDSV